MKVPRNEDSPCQQSNSQSSLSERTWLPLVPGPQGPQELVHNHQGILMKISPYHPSSPPFPLRLPWLYQRRTFITMSRPSTPTYEGGPKEDWKVAISGSSTAQSRKMITARMAAQRSSSILTTTSLWRWVGSYEDLSVRVAQTKKVSRARYALAYTTIDASLKVAQAYLLGRRPDHLNFSRRYG